MYKKNILFASLIILSTTAFAADDSCKNYSEDAKNICNDVATTKTNFYNKYAMSTDKPTEDKRDTSSCNGLSGIEKDTCLTKNNVVSQYSLTKPTTPSTPAKPSSEASKYNEKMTTPVKVQPEAKPSSSTTQEQTTKPTVNIYRD